MLANCLLLLGGKIDEVGTVRSVSIKRKEVIKSHGREIEACSKMDVTADGEDSPTNLIMKNRQINIRFATKRKNNKHIPS